jgi:hypothetical protein
MSGYVLELPGADNPCVSYAPGHLTHWIQFRLSMTQPTAVIPVTARIDDDGIVYIDGDDVAATGWHHRPELLRDALHRYDGMAVWKPRFYLLAVPTDTGFGGPRSVFSIARLDERRDCRMARPAEPDPVVPRAPAPTNVPPLRIATRYAAGRPRPR